jgi:hypothetical protein
MNNVVRNYSSRPVEGSALAARIRALIAAGELGTTLAARAAGLSAWNPLRAGQRDAGHGGGFHG